MKYFSSHIMRHSFTTRCFEVGIDVKIIQSVLGRSRIETTMGILCTFLQLITKSISTSR